tara:strand:+ start:79 stop:450 length:372 start_codon:yes stop_codon:yes gene_type:complete
MVSTSKMVQFGYRLIQLILLCQFWQLGFTSPREPEYSSIRFQPSDKGEIALFLIAVVIGEIGKKLDKGYRCPVYCEVDHKHIYWEKYESKESNIPPDDGIPRPGEPEDREQSKGNIRPIASIH